MGMLVQDNTPMGQALFQQAHEAMAKKAQVGGLGGSILGAIWAAIGENAATFGVLFAGVSMICTITGSVWLIRHKRYQIKLTKAQLKKLERDLREEE